MASWTSRPGPLLTGPLLAVAVSLPMGTQAIVNIESQRSEATAEPLQGHLELGLSGDSGNSDRNEWRLGGRLQWSPSSTARLLFIGRLNYGESRGVRSSNRAFAHLRLTRQSSPGRAIEFFGQMESDEFSRLNLRALLGAGLRLTRPGDDDRQAFGIGLYHAWERLSDDGLADQTSEQFWRANTYWHLQKALSPRLTVSSTLYLQPRIGPVTDLRILEQLACEIPLLTTLKFRLSLDLTHDSRPPAGVEQTDLHYRSTFRYDF